MRQILYIALCSIIFTLSAQESLMPFPKYGQLSETTNKKYIQQKQKQRIAALNLPFIEDFYQSAIYPDVTKWQDNLVYVNQTFDLHPVSIGMAIFDGLDASGQPYSNVPNSTGIADRLTSQSLDLSGLSKTDNVLMSFFYAYNTLGETPENNKDFLYLQFLDERNEWQTVWQKTPNKNDDSTNFKQIFIAIDTPFLHNNFQFKFYNIGSLYGLSDIWALDYIRIDKDRDSIFDSNIKDMAFQYPAPSLLKRYYNMPYNHFDSTQMADTILLSVKNNFINPTTDFVDRYTAKVLNVGATLNIYNGPSRDFLPLTENKIPYPLFQIPETYTDDTIVIETNFSFDVTAEDISIPEITNNNKLKQTQVFSNYFAYDDGSPERAYWVRDVDNYKMAVKYELKVPDTLRAIKYQFTQVKSDIKNAKFSVVVWKNVEFNSTNEHIIYKEDNLKMENLVKEFGYDTINGLLYYNIKPEYIVDNNYSFPLVLTDSFLVGVIVQDRNTLSVGFDRNNNKQQYNYFVSPVGDYANKWLKSDIKGTMIMNPVFGKELPWQLTPIKNNNTYAIKVFPNPAQKYLHLSGIKEKTNVQITDLNGKLIQSFNTDIDRIINIENLASSIYILSVRNLETQAIGTIKFIKN
ncbi:MAG TPA: T9SS type A sorting domain-containing protein [Chitinophagales bacterium]|nr:T9SS type A sorting domain-containing protein [Chitinophagales bacterium]